jgi:tRNA dimethylallyltransferase
MTSRMILIFGQTASGKGRLAFELARQIGAEIISIDSMKVYRRMDIGTAKPSTEMRQQVKYYLIDVVEPSEVFSAGKFLQMAHSAIEKIKSAGKPVIAAGGTAMYIKALLYGLFEGPGSDERVREQLKMQIATEGLPALYAELSRVDPLAARRISRNDAKRIIRALEVYRISGEPISGLQQQNWACPYKGQWKIIGIRSQKADANHRINMRVKRMMEQGLVEEVRSLLAEDKPLSPQARCAIGYAEIIDCLAGRSSLDEAVEKIKINTRRFAKGQRTWFKTFRDVNWLDVAADEPGEQILERTLSLLEKMLG